MSKDLKNEIYSGINLKKVNEESVYDEIFKGLRLYMARIVCCILLHIMCLKEVKISLEMMNFAKNNWKRFGDSPTASTPPFMIVVIKLVSSFLTECLNLIIVVCAESVIDVVKDFVALLVVLYISFIMTQSITGQNIPVVIASTVIEYPVYQNYLTITEEVKNIKNLKGTFFQKATIGLITFVSRMCNFIYYSIYFYFWPLMILVITNLYAEDPLEY